METLQYPEIEYLLKKVGKDVFVSILYPELKKDRNVSIEELSSKYPRYREYTINSQRTRLTKARKIFDLDMVKEAFLIILSSKRLQSDIRSLAEKYLKLMELP